ncbi:MAG: CHASE domain-containing protein [Novosphingobium sp.]
MDQALLTRVEKQAWFHRYPRGLPIALFALGMIVTVLFVLNLELADSAARDLALDRDSTALATEIERRSTENIAYLNAAASLFSIADEVGKQEFAQFVTDMSVGHQTRSALGIGWVRWFKAAEIPEVAREKHGADPATRFTIRPQPTDRNADMAVIDLLEPQTPENLHALGYDMYSEPVRRAAMDEAIRTGRPIASGMVQLIQDENQQPSAGIVIYLPVFERARSGAVMVRGRLKGFIYSPIRVQEMLQASLGNVHQNAAGVTLYDGTPRSGRMLASTLADGPGSNGLVRRISFGGRTWTLVVSGPSHRGLTNASLLILSLGTMISLLMAALAWVITSRAREDRQVLEWFADQEAIRTSLSRELNHRVKNTLANVLSIVALTRRRTTSKDDFADGLNGRIRALSATHDLLSKREWKDAPIRDVVSSELAPYLDPEDPHAEVSGPDALLAPNDALSLGLALHELATNAAKYGALSAPQGQVAVTWTLPAPDRCEVLWREKGGPPVTPPQRRGFGLDLIEKIVSHELLSPIDLRFDPDGVSCRIVVPLRAARTFTIREPRAG